MIYATFERTDKKYNKFTLSGHAESGPYGHDLVCAAVSALTIGTANNLSRIASIEPEIKANEEEGGFLEVVVPFVDDAMHQRTAQILLENLYLSLLDIQKEYREIISVSLNNLN